MAPPWKNNDGVLKGAVIFIQSHGRTWTDIQDDIRFIWVSRNEAGFMFFGRKGCISLEAGGAG
jgi:hypothetical protein